MLLSSGSNNVVESDNTGQRLHVPGSPRYLVWEEKGRKDADGAGAVS